MRMVGTDRMCNATEFGGTMVTIAETQKTATEEKRTNPNTKIETPKGGFHTSCGQAYIRFDK